MAGVLSRLPDLKLQIWFSSAIKARHPLRAFFFWANLSGDANFNSWRATICFPLRLEILPEEKSSPAAENFRNQPLAARMRPRNLDEYAGQTHILAPGQLLRRAIEADRIQSLIFYGPPGTGKTSLAQIIARQTKSKFERLSGVESNVADMRRVLSGAANRLENTGQSTILFIDEIHRFNKSQQDVLLPDVESGVVKLIGATTHNPFFFVNSPLVSRSQIFELRPLTEEDLFSLLQRALADEERGLGYMKISADENALRHLAKISDGDARKALNALEIAALTTAPDQNGDRQHHARSRRAKHPEKGRRL